MLATAQVTPARPSLLPKLPVVVLLLFVGDLFFPNLQSGTGLMDADIDARQEMLSSGSILRQVFWPSLVVLALAVAAACRAERHVLVAGRWFWALAALMLASAAWSEYPSLTLRRACLQLLIFAAVMLSVHAVGTRQAMEELVFKVGCLLLAAELAALLLLPRQAFDALGAFKGLHENKNQAGLLASIYCGASFLFYRARLATQRRAAQMALAAAAGWLLLLLLSQSKTCIAALAAYLLLSPLVGRKGIVNVTLLILLLTVLVAFAFPLACRLLAIDPVPIFAEVFYRLDLTGRAEIWNRLLERIVSAPWLGSGYAAYWMTGEVPLEMDVRYSFLRYVNQGHNGYLDVLIALGFVGLGLLLGALLYILFRHRRSLSAFQVFVFYFAVIHNITESSWLRDAQPTWIFTILALAMITAPSGPVRSVSVR